MQERQVYETKVQPANQLNVRVAIQPNIPTLQQLDNKQPSINVPDLGISFVFVLLTPDVNKGEEQIPMKRKKKNPKWSFRRSCNCSQSYFPHLCRLFPSRDFTGVFGRRKHTGITNGTRITSTAVRWWNRTKEKKYIIDIYQQFF